jgi:ribosomal-protein-alanine N-acetyltransferase
MNLLQRPLTPADAAAAAALHAQGFADPWSAASIADLIAQPTVVALGAEASGALIAFVVFQSAAGDTELLTIATDPARRGEGHARRLIEAGFTALSAAGNTRVLLDVADDNGPALHLYTSLGFMLDGRRKAYYTAGRPAPVDALLMSRKLQG